MTAPVLYATAADWHQPVAAVARYVLATIEAKYAELSEYVAPLPDRRQIAVGSITADSPILAVMYGGTAIGLPGNDFSQPMRGDTPRTATFNIELWRNTQLSSAGGYLPAPDEVVSDYAFTTMQDSHALLEAAGACDPRGTGVAASVTVNEPSGELQGVSMFLQIVIL